MEIVLLITGFALCLLSYRLGIKDGQAIKRDQSISPLVKSPVRAVQEHVKGKEVEKQADSMLKGIENLLSYDGTKQEEPDDN